MLTVAGLGPLSISLFQCFPGDSQVDVQSGSGLSWVASAVGAVCPWTARDVWEFVVGCRTHPCLPETRGLGHWKGKGNLRPRFDLIYFLCEAAFGHYLSC